MIVIVFGLPGSGKTYFAEAFAKKLNATYINSDAIRETFPDSNRYSHEEKNAVYDMMLRRMLVAMHEGKSVVLDATFYKEDLRRRFTSYAREQGMLYFIKIVANDSLIKERLAGRQNSHADYNVYKLIEQDWDPVLFPHLTIQSTNDNIEEMITKGLDYLKQHQERVADSTIK